MQRVKDVTKNLLASLAHSHRALRAQLARISAPRARDLIVVALRAPTYMNFALDFTFNLRLHFYNSLKI